MPDQEIKRVVDKHHPPIAGKSNLNGRAYNEEAPAIPNLTPDAGAENNATENLPSDYFAPGDTNAGLSPDDSSDSDKKNPLGAPIVKVLGKEIPLFVHPLSEKILRGAATGYGYTRELGRGAWDRALKVFTAANKRPEIIVTDTEGLTVVMELPVEQVTDSGPTSRRVQKATERLIQDGKYVLTPKLPPGEPTHPRDPRSKSKIIPTASSEQIIHIFPRNSVAKSRSEFLQMTHSNWPSAFLELRGGPNETSLHMLKKRKVNIELAHQVASVIMPDLELFINMRYMDTHGYMNNAIIEFSLSENSLRFGPDGEPLPLDTTVGGNFFHPALISLRDFSQILSARLFEKSGANATINPNIIFNALNLAPSADEDTRVIIEPYMYRMIAIGRINQLLTQHPGEFAGAIARTVNFTDAEGKPLSPEKANIIGTELIGSILGLPDAPHQIANLTYVDFVSMFHKILEDNHAYLQWAGNSKIVSAAVETARTMPELHELVKKMGVNNLESFGEVRKTMSSADFFALSLTPEILFIKAVAILEEEVGQAVVARAEAQRTLAKVQTIIHIVEATSAINDNVWAAVRDEFDRQVAKLSSGKLEGNKIGRGVADRVKGEYRLSPKNSSRRTPAGPIIDGIVRPLNDTEDKDK